MQVESYLTERAADRNMAESKIFIIVPLSVDRARSTDA